MTNTIMIFCCFDVVYIWSMLFSLNVPQSQ